MDNKCTGIPRFTIAGEHYDRWYCQSCMCVMFLPHGEAPPDEHERSKNILPQGDSEPAKQLIRNNMSVAPVATQTALQRLTANLPGDISIVKKD